jgi:hypothetical protein
MIRLTLRPKTALVATGSLLLLFLAPLAAFAPFGIPGEVWIGAGLGVLVMVIVLVRVLFGYYQWFELEDGVIRGRKLLTRRFVEWKVRDIEGVNPVGLKELGLPVHGERRLGYEVWFPGGKLLLSRYEMAGLDEFMDALADQIADGRR